MSTEAIIQLIGGLGLFLYGMTLMGDGLQKTAGSKLRTIIGILTTNRFLGIIVGAFVTMVVQSSSATTVMVVGFVNAGLMSLIQATGVIMGANIGTTVTAQIVALNLSDVAPLVIGLAVGVWIFAKNKKTKSSAEIFIGFGLLFLGMAFMKNGLKPLREMPEFTQMILSFDPDSISSYIIAILVGFGFTALVQSSSATTGILVAMAMEGLIGIEIALPIIFGSNIGTCVTALLSSIGASRTAKRAAIIHFMFNFIGTTVFALFFRTPIVIAATAMSPDSAARQLANAHTLFNISNTLLLLPFAKYLVIAAEKIIPATGDEEVEDEVHLDERMLGTPALAIGQVIEEVDSMSKLATRNYDRAINALIDNDVKAIEKVMSREQIINEKQRALVQYLVKLMEENLSVNQRERVNMTLGLISDIERIGDHAENIAELAEYKIENKFEFSQLAVEELNDMHRKVLKSCKQSIDAFKNNDIELASKIIMREDKIDKIEATLRKSHIDRLNQGLCQPNSGVIFLDAISNMERIADHTEKIAYYVMDMNK